MILGVPTLNRYDLLGKLIVSAEAGRLKPSAYLIVDNGGRLGWSTGLAMACVRGVEIHVLTPGANIGVAASWNAILDRAGADPVTIVNDDIELGEDVLEALDRAIGKHDFVIAEGGPNANGWCCFAQTLRCTELVRFYDENFFPAYYEDSDYEQRLRRVGIIPHREPVTLRHEGWATMKADPSISVGQQRSADFFRKKWGGMPNEVLSPEPAFEPKKSPRRTEWKRYEPMTMRWDVINHIVETIGAKSYLEIGVSNGENMRHVRISEKIGVDPNPTIEGVKSSDIFYSKESDEFFEAAAFSGRPSWDVAFVDGLHYADQAYRDIINAACVARVVVVHDANPSTEAMQRVPYESGDWTGDVWKAIAHIRAEGIHLVRTVDTDFGVAIVIPNRGDGGEYRVRELPRETWNDLQSHRQELLGLIQASEWKAWFEKAIR